MCEAGVARTLTNNTNRNNTMSYKKPEIVASSEATQSYVAGCPTEKVQFTHCSTYNTKCMCGPLK
jgi:hypothetical protein